MKQDFHQKILHSAASSSVLQSVIKRERSAGERNIMCCQCSHAAQVKCVVVRKRYKNFYHLA